MSDFNETYADAINSNSEERTSSMSDYSTSTTLEENRYQENTPTVTPEIVDAGTDVDLIDTNPVAALAENFQNESSGHPLAPGETNYTEEEARRVTEDLKVKLLHALEAQYDFTHAAERAFDGHIWVARLSRGHEGLDRILRRQLRRGEDPRNRPAAHRPYHRLHSGQDQQPWHRRPARCQRMDRP